MRMLEVFVLKFKTVSKLQLPVLMNKHRQQQQQLQQQLQLQQQQQLQQQLQLQQQQQSSAPSTPGGSSDVKAPVMALATATTSSEDVKPAMSPSSGSVGANTEKGTEEEKRCKFGFPQSQAR